MYIYRLKKNSIILSLSTTSRRQGFLTSMASGSLCLPTFLSSVSSSVRFNSTLSFFSLSPEGSFLFLRQTRGGKHRSVRAMAPDLLGDFGARDPFPAELESKFGEKVVGNESTEHRILIPNLSLLSLANQSCEPVPSSQLSFSKEDAEKLLKKVVGWRIVECEEGMKLQCTWRVRDYGCGIELITRIYRALEASRHYPNLHLEQPNQIRAELWTTSIDGLSLNDFIIAAKIDQVKTLDLLPKKRIWA